MPHDVQEAIVNSIVGLESAEIVRYGYAIAEIRTEARQKLTQIRPISLGQASRISGVSPTDVSILMIYLAGKKKE